MNNTKNVFFVLINTKLKPLQSAVEERIVKQCSKIVIRGISKSSLQMFMSL